MVKYNANILVAKKAEYFKFFLQKHPPYFLDLYIINTASSLFFKRLRVEVKKRVAIVYRTNGLSPNTYLSSNGLLFSHTHAMYG